MVRVLVPEEICHVPVQARSGRIAGRRNRLGAARISPAWAVQDQPVSIGGVESVCTGVGSAKDNPDWNGYPVKLVFANSAGEDLAAVHVAVSQGGKTVMETDCDAPWLLLKAPSGSYGVRATVGPRTATANFSSGGGGQKEVTVMFPKQAAIGRAVFKLAARGARLPRARSGWRQERPQAHGVAAWAVAQRRREGGSVQKRKRAGELSPTGLIIPQSV